MRPPASMRLPRRRTKMTSATLSSDASVVAPTPAPAAAPAAETDSIPRTNVRNLMSAVQFVARARTTTLDALRVKLNTDRRDSSAGTRGYSTARDVASELAKLGLADVGPLPKDSKGFEKKRDTKIRIIDAGEE